MGVSADGGFVMAERLKVGSRVFAADGSELWVTTMKKYHDRNLEMVKLQTEGATLIVTETHRMVCPDTIKQARELKRGDEVRCSTGVDRLVNVEKFVSEGEVISVTFVPDMPIASYHLQKQAILSMGMRR